MVDQLSSVEICRACGSPLGENRGAGGELCDSCLARQWNGSTPDGSRQSDHDAAPRAAPINDYYAAAAAQPEGPADPDRPGWGPLLGIGVWLFSVAAILLVPVAVVIVWYVLDKQRGVEVPLWTDRDALVEYLQSPRLLLVQIYSTIIAHLISLGLCWMVVTRLKSRPFLKTLGWDWGRWHAARWLLFSFAVFMAIIGVDLILSRVLPQSESPFTQILNKSYQIKVAVAVLATFSAPFVEEVIYRGVLFAGLRKFLGVRSTVIAVTVLFAGVHVPQYWGQWASIAGLLLLSLILTIVRARTRSVLPCVVIHFVNNSIISLLLVLGLTS
ncbi:MAG: CPBP family intramembrane glutamic endopeptidase [Blastocatellia bacterium]